MYDLVSSLRLLVHHTCPFSYLQYLLHSFYVSIVNTLVQASFPLQTGIDRGTDCPAKSSLFTGFVCYSQSEQGKAQRDREVKEVSRKCRGGKSFTRPS